MPVVRDLEVGRIVRMLRRRRGWRQEDCARRAGLHRSTWSLLERGLLEGMTLDTIRRCLAVLEVRLDLRPRWRGAELSRLLDQAHASLQVAWVQRLGRRGWQTWIERSYSVYGERGRVDILGYHPKTRTLLVVEIKSELADAQSLLGSLDVKVRLAPSIARGMGLPAVDRVVPMIAFADSMTTRRRVARLAELFSSFETRGPKALAWLRSPAAGTRGLLIFSGATGSRVRGPGGHRVRLRHRLLITNSQPTGPSAVPERPDDPSYATGGSG